MKPEPRSGTVQVTTVPPSGAGADLERAAGQVGAVVHDAQAHAPLVGRSGGRRDAPAGAVVRCVGQRRCERAATSDGCLGAGAVEPGPVVLDAEPELVRAPNEADGDVRGPAVLDGVRDGLLGDPEQVRRCVGVQGRGFGRARPRRLGLDGDGVECRGPLGEAGKGGLQPVALQLDRDEQTGQPAGLDVGLVEETDEPVDLGGARRAVGVETAGDAAQEQPDGRELLTETVVEVLPDPAPLRLGDPQHLALQHAALRDVADEPGEDAPAAGERHLTHRQVHRERGARLAPPDHLTPDPDDAPDASLAVVLDVPVVLPVVWLGHEHMDVASDDLLGVVLEDPLGARIEGLDLAPLVDGDDAVDRRLEDGLGARPALFQRVARVVEGEPGVERACGGAEERPRLGSERPGLGRKDGQKRERPRVGPDPDRQPATNAGGREGWRDRAQLDARRAAQGLGQDALDGERLRRWVPAGRDGRLEPLAVAVGESEQGGWRAERVGDDGGLRPSRRVGLAEAGLRQLAER